MKEKICRTKEDYIGLMKTLEKYKFRWRCGQNPTEIGFFPVKICFGYWGESSKVLTYSHSI